MDVKVRVTEVFQSQFKRLYKKYPSLASDLLELEKRLKENPRLGVSLGRAVYKVRLAIRSKGKGKSGGARVITYVEAGRREKSQEAITVVNFITIYDKSEVAATTVAELRELIKSIATPE